MRKITLAAAALVLVATGAALASHGRGFYPGAK